jgi:Sulfotransferase family
MDEAWPNLFVVGVGRAGTTSLAHYLGGHRDIFMSPVKEPHFFSRARPGPTVVKDEGSYLRLFSGATHERWRGEASVSYFWDEGSAAAIRARSPDARIVIVLREPVARAHSSYWRAVRYGETRTFLEAVRAELSAPLPRNGDVAHPGYVAPGFYADPVERYERTFPGGVRVLFFEEVVADPRRELRHLLEFLEVDPEYADRRAFDVRNRALVPRNELARRLLFSWRIRGVARALVPESVRPRVDRLVLGDGPQPEMESEARHLLEEAYAADRERLEQVLHRRVPW